MKKNLRSVLLLICAVSSLVFSVVSCELFFGDDNELTPVPGEPPEPTYIYPPENGTAQSRTPTFIWNHYRDELVLNYKFFLFYTESNFFMEIEYDSTLTFPDTLDALTEYSWRILVVTEYDEYVQGPKWIFTTGTGFNNPPLVPYDPDPADGSSSNPLYATLSWDCRDLDGDNLTYDVWLDTFDADSVLVGNDLTIKTVDPGDLEPDRRYLWKVVAFDSHGDSTAGPWWAFKTVTASNKPPVEPWGPYPPDNAANVSLDVTLDWSCSDPEDDPITYDVAMGPAGHTLTVIGSDLTESSFDVTGLDPLTEYEWNVLATDDHYHTTPGPIWSFTTGDGTSSDVFAALNLGRSITYDGTIRRNDYIFARFDSLYAPGDPINPLQPAAVSCNTFDLIWQEGMKEYAYTDYVAGYFLNPGATYTFFVTEGDGVPALTTDPIVFPVCQPYITSPEPFSYVSMSGFDLEWHTFCSGTIDITIMDLNADSTGVYITTENDGFYTFTADDLSVIDPGAYQLQIVLIHENRQAITAVGYDPRSWVWARVLSTQIVYRQ